MFENGSFDATTVQPSQGGSKIMPGMYDAYISNTFGKSTKDQTGGMLIVEFTTPSGTIEKRFNCWNSSAQAVEIAGKELSALCHAVGIFKITATQNDLANAARELRNSKCKIIVGFQAKQEPTQENPEGGYTEVKKVLDINGNEPGKPPAQLQPQPNPGFQQPPQNAQQQPGNQPMVQQPGGGWTNAQPQPQTSQQAPQRWQQPQGNPAPQNQPASQPNQSGQTWQPGNPAGNGTPPWGNRT